MIAYPTAIVNCFHAKSSGSISLKRAGYVCNICIDKALGEIQIGGHNLPFCDLCDETPTRVNPGPVKFFFPFALCEKHVRQMVGVTRLDYLELAGWV